MFKKTRNPLSCPSGGGADIRPARLGAWRAVAAALSCLFAASVPARADTVLGTATFTYTGGAQTYTVPAGTNYVVIKAWGAGGGAGVLTPGGSGAFVTATYNASPGQQFSLYVGGPGQGYLSGGWPGGGSAQGLGGAGGGGYTRVITPMGEVWAGAGGGGGNGYTIGGGGGGGGGPNGGGGGSAAGGGGASQSGGGGGGAGQSYGYGGGYAQGGAAGADISYVGGGGGGGYYGGGGGASGDANQSPPTGGGGGGGGSSVVSGSPTAYTYAAGGGAPGGTGDPHYPGGGVGYGGAGVYGAGYPGAVVIIAYQYSIPPAITSSLATRSYYLNQAASYTITASYSPTSFGAANLPPGLSVNAATGVISGTATAAGSYSSTISASNPYGTATATLVWNIFGPSRYTVAGIELDDIFEPIGTTTPRAAVGIDSLGVDLAQRYRSSVWGATDQIAYDTGYQSGSTDLRYFFRRKGYVSAVNPVATTFNYTGGGQTYTVPAGTQYVVIKVWGAGGGAGVNTPGGGGAFVTATYNASPGQQFTLYVGGAGQGYLSGGWPGGGSAQGLGGAGGGGYTRVITPMGEVWAVAVLASPAVAAAVLARVMGMAAVMPRAAPAARISATSAAVAARDILAAVAGLPAMPTNRLRPVAVAAVAVADHPSCRAVRPPTPTLAVASTLPPAPATRTIPAVGSATAAPASMARATPAPSSSSRMS